MKGQQHTLCIQRPVHSLWALLLRSWMTSEQQENNLVTRRAAHRRRRRKRSLKSSDFLSSYECDARFSHRFATSLTLKQYVYNVLSAGSTESAPVYGISLHTATFPEEASRMGFSDKFKLKYFLAFNLLFSLHLLNSSGSSFGHKHAVF